MLCECVCIHTKQQKTHTSPSGEGENVFHRRVFNYTVQCSVIRASQMNCV